MTSTYFGFSNIIVFTLTDRNINMGNLESLTMDTALVSQQMKATGFTIFELFIESVRYLTQVSAFNFLFSLC